MQKKPVILITLDSQKGTSNGYSNRDWYCLRKDYSTVISEMNGIPLMMPQEKTNIPHYLSLADGIIFSGGDFDVDPFLYGETCKHETCCYNQSRNDFEYQLMMEALKTDIPVLGICAGEQMMGVATGGKLVQCIEKEIKNPIEHKTKNSLLKQTMHSITIEKNSKLFDIIKKEKITTNSFHRQSVKEVGQSMIVSAITEDGVIEAIEHREKQFFIGIQWHPELKTTEYDVKILNAFLKSAQEHHIKKLKFCRIL